MKFCTVKLHHILRHLAKFEGSAMFLTKFLRDPNFSPFYHHRDSNPCHTSENEPRDLKFCIVKLHHIVHHAAKFCSPSWFLSDSNFEKNLALSEKELMSRSYRHEAYSDLLIGAKRIVLLPCCAAFSSPGGVEGGK